MNHVTELKNQTSRKPVPLHPSVLASLLALRGTSAFNRDTDWVFASVKAKGRVPIWPSSLMSDHILPAVKDREIEKHVSWHVFRGSYATLLKANGEDVKTVQDSLRRATFQVTMDSYAQSIPQAVRSAHGKVVEQLTVSDILNGPALDLGALNSSVSC
jgi:integrase